AARHRSAVAVPLIGDGRPIGAISVGRDEVRPFGDNEIAVLQTFASQAVIAIENVRLFKELEARHAELTGILPRQMATGEVLRAISQAQTDAQPVFDIIAASALRLCGAGYSWVTLYDGEWLRIAAIDNVNPEAAAAMVRAHPRRVDQGTAQGRAIRTRAVVQIPDVLEDPAYELKGELQPIGG